MAHLPELVFRFKKTELCSSMDSGGGKGRDAVEEAERVAAEPLLLLTSKAAGACVKLIGVLLLLNIMLFICQEARQGQWCTCTSDVHAGGL